MVDIPNRNTLAVISHGDQRAVKFFEDVAASINTSNQSGSSRPANPSIGPAFYDTSLGKPIWWNGAIWTDAFGVAV